MDPNGRPIVVVDPRNQFSDLTMAGIFFESREPPASEFSMADLEKAFPEGMYKVRGRSFDGTVLTGQAKFTHHVPAPPEITSPNIADEPEQPGTPIPRQDLTVSWDPVRNTVDGEPVKITGYEVIVTKEVPDDPHGFSRPTYDVHVPASVNTTPERPRGVPRTRHRVRAGGAGPRGERQPDHQRRLLQDKVDAILRQGSPRRTRDATRSSATSTTGGQRRRTACRPMGVALNLAGFIARMPAPQPPLQIAEVLPRRQGWRAGQNGRSDRRARP